jgi:segregation and condensation protein B
MNPDEIRSAIEAVLYAAGDPVPMAALAEALELTPLEIRSVIREMTDLYNYERRGIQIVTIEDCVQFSTRKEHAELIRRVLAPAIRQSLSTAALETLSIIAYIQPVTRGEIEQIRGVRCEYAVASLLRKKLIEPVGHGHGGPSPHVLNPQTFLRTFGCRAGDERPA